ncbi:hypothetical protein K438DRAFT_1751255 [Mycena galopus ATCC 62051]|nr:hypothetical protein K438DRAFT_1751255 [Mycena galopus ATCC 62051]
MPRQTTVKQRTKKIRRSHQFHDSSCQPCDEFENTPGEHRIRCPKRYTSQETRNIPNMRKPLASPARDVEGTNQDKITKNHKRSFRRMWQLVMIVSFWVYAMFYLGRKEVQGIRHLKPIHCPVSKPQNGGTIEQFDFFEETMEATVIIQDTQDPQVGAKMIGSVDEKKAKQTVVEGDKGDKGHVIRVNDHVVRQAVL